MKPDNPFDEKIDLWHSKGKLLPGWYQAFSHVVDMLEVSEAAARALFEENAKPEHAIAIYDRVVARVQSPGVSPPASD